MSWQEQLRGDSLSWLLETDEPGVRYLAMRDLLDLYEEDPDLCTARADAHRRGPIAEVMANMSNSGYWVEPGPGYNPKYTSTVWSLILLAQVGASVKEEPQIIKACEHYLENAFTPGGQLSASGTPSGTADCIQGNMLWVFSELGFDDPRLEKAFDWMARSVTGEGIAPVSDRMAEVRYYAGKCGPLFACGANDRKPCAWGGVKVMLALARIPAEQRTPIIQRAIQQGVDFLLSVDLVAAAWPSGYSAKPSSNWWKFGFPVFYITDLLQVAEALVALGYSSDPRLQRLLNIIINKQNENGRWLLEYDYTGKTWVNFGEKKQPNKWVTLRALRVLKNATHQLLEDEK